MVKAKVISRSTLEWTKDRAGEVPRAHRNYDPKLNPMAKQVEYTRAVRAAKLDRLFAKPFLAAMSVHRDTVQSLALDPTNVSCLASGAADGQVVVWDCMTHKPRRTLEAHRNAVDGATFTPDGTALLTASRDRTVRLWDTAFDSDEATPLAEFLGSAPFTGVDHHWVDTTFVTSGHALELWDINRTRPIQTFAWGDETVLTARFNRVETHLVALSSMDRGVTIYDTRTKAGHTKSIMTMSCSTLAWNPMDPNLLLAGSDDWNCYLFDMRSPGKPRSVYQGPVHPITSVDWAPTGRAFAAGAADCTVRMWEIDSVVKSSSTEMYHTKRMAKVQAVRWSLDNNFIFSGSEDAVVRVWKADSSKPIRPLRGSEKGQFNYMRSLKQQYASFPEVRRIANQRHTPKHLKKQQLRRKALMTNEMVKEMSRRKTTDLKPLASRKTIQSLK